MSTVRIWIAAAHDAAHLNGGWAFVRAGTGVYGAAGGDRRTTRARTALSGFIASLKDVPEEASLAVVAPRTDAMVLHQFLKPPKDAPTEDLELRATLAGALNGRTWTLALGDPDALTPFTFAVAWADMASEKAKLGGAFVAAIPKTNLAKAKGL